MSCCFFLLYVCSFVKFADIPGIVFLLFGFGVFLKFGDCESALRLSFL